MDMGIILGLMGAVLLITLIQVKRFNQRGN